MADKWTKTYNLDLSEVPREQRARVKQEIGELLVGEILTYVGDGKSPVQGQGSFKKLNKQYANEQKGGDRNPNLDLEGDMLNALTYKNTRNGIEVGIFDSTQAAKAEGHNTGFKGHPRLEGVAPKRQFIPDDDQGFKKQIEARVKRVIKDYTPPKDNQTRPETTFPTTPPQTARSTQIDINDLFDDNFIEGLFDARNI